MRPDNVIIKAQDLAMRFPSRDGLVHAVNGVTLSIRQGEVVGLVGESGSGKSTVGRCLVRLLQPSDGRITFMGCDITHMRQNRLRALRKDMQIVFQSPYAALNPRMRIDRLIEEPLKLHSSNTPAERQSRVHEVAETVRLSPGLLQRYPNELSGGQLQRACIARALVTEPKLMILDEPTSALDLSVRAGIIDLLCRLKEEMALSMLFISHDLDTVRSISDRVLVMYLGSLVEAGPARRVHDLPQHPYTRALMSAHLPAKNTQRCARITFSGEPPSPVNLPTGCALHQRCPIATGDCAVRVPHMIEVAQGHYNACLRAKEDISRLMDVALVGKKGQEIAGAAKS